ncbi:MAG: BrnA antitoxin family protein [Deltaproteobacteria bacterium]
MDFTLKMLLVVHASQTAHVIRIISAWKATKIERQTYEKKYDFSKGKHGAVVEPEPGKSRITIRLDNEVLDWFRTKADAQGVVVNRP